MKTRTDLLLMSTHQPKAPDMQKYNPQTHRETIQETRGCSTAVCTCRDVHAWMCHEEEHRRRHAGKQRRARDSARRSRAMASQQKQEEPWQWRRRTEAHQDDERKKRQRKKKKRKKTESKRERSQEYLDAVGDHDFFKRAGLDPLDGRAAEEAMGSEGENSSRSLLSEFSRSLTQGPSGIDHVIDDDHV